LRNDLKADDLRLLTVDWLTLIRFAAIRSVRPFARSSSSRSRGTFGAPNGHIETFVQERSISEKSFLAQASSQPAAKLDYALPAPARDIRNAILGGNGQKLSRRSRC